MYLLKRDSSRVAYVWDYVYDGAMGGHSRLTWMDRRHLVEVGRVVVGRMKVALGKPVDESQRSFSRLA